MTSVIPGKAGYFFLNIKIMYKITLLNIEWNEWNGFNLEFLGLEFWNIDSSLFALRIANKLYIDILYFTIEINTPWGSKI